MYYDCVQFIKGVKQGCPFIQSSPKLGQLTECENWHDVLEELNKEFKNEVIGKHPVIKHLKFGSLLSFGDSNK